LAFAKLLYILTYFLTLSIKTPKNGKNSFLVIFGHPEPIRLRSEPALNIAEGINFAEGLINQKIFRFF